MRKQNLCLRRVCKLQRSQQKARSLESGHHGENDSAGSELVLEDALRGELDCQHPAASPAEPRRLSSHNPCANMLPCILWRSACFFTFGGRSCCMLASASVSPFPAGLI